MASPKDSKSIVGYCCAAARIVTFLPRVAQKLSGLVQMDRTGAQHGGDSRIRSLSSNFPKSCASWQSLTKSGTRLLGRTAQGGVKTRVSREGEDGSRINFPLEPDNARADRQLALGASSLRVQANDQVADVCLSKGGELLL